MSRRNTDHRSGPGDDTGVSRFTTLVAIATRIVESRYGRGAVELYAAQDPAGEPSPEWDRRIAHGWQPRTQESLDVAIDDLLIALVKYNGTK